MSHDEVSYVGVVDVDRTRMVRWDAVAYQNAPYIAYGYTYFWKANVSHYWNWLSSPITEGGEDSTLIQDDL